MEIKPSARKGIVNRVILNCRIDIETMEAIKMLAKLWQCSQSEVIDKWYKSWIEYKRLQNSQQEQTTNDNH